MIFLFQHVTFPTQARNSQRSSLLDLIITYEGNIIDNLTATDPLGKSDHYMLEYEYVCSCDVLKSDICMIRVTIKASLKNC